MLGRIPGPLLETNLIRNNVDLAFDTDLLYLDTQNDRIGIKTDTPSYALHVVGTVQANSFSGNLNYSDITNPPIIGNGTLTVTGGSGLSGSGSFDANAETNNTVTLSHANTTTQASVSNTGRTYIQSITLDDYGHITELTTASETVVNTDNYLELLSFDTSNGILTAGRTGSLGNVTIDLDGRYLLQESKAADSELLDNLTSSQFLRSDVNDSLTGNLDITGILDVQNNTFYVNNTNNRVGIGTNQPAQKLDVQGNILLTGSLQGPGTFVIDPAAYGDNTGTLVVAGNLQVDGTTTTINSTTLTVEDMNLVIAQGAADSQTANGAGITIDGADATITYNSAEDEFVFNKGIKAKSIVSSDNEQKINILEYVVSDTNENTIAEIDSTLYRTAKIIIQVYDTVTGESYSTEVLVTHNDSQSFATEFATVYTSLDPLTSIDTKLDTTTNKIKIKAQNSSNNTTEFRISLLQIGV